MFVVFVCLLALVCVLPLCLLVLWDSCWWSTCSAVCLLFFVVCWLVCFCFCVCWLAVVFFVGLCICWFCGFVVFCELWFVVFAGLLALVWVLLLCVEPLPLGFVAQHTSSSRLCPRSAVGAWPAAPSVFLLPPVQLLSCFAVHFVLFPPLGS